MRSQIILAVRSLYKLRYYYAAALFIFIAAFSCGIFTSAKHSEIGFAGGISYILPSLVIINASGLFFSGNILILAFHCFCAYKMGFMLGGAFTAAFWQGAAFVFFVLLPVYTVYITVILLSSVNGVRCNLRRFVRRQRGVVGHMNVYELKKYAARCMIISGVGILWCIMEKYIFLKAFLNLFY